MAAQQTAEELATLKAFAVESRVAILNAQQFKDGIRSSRPTHTKRSFLRVERLIPTFSRTSGARVAPEFLNMSVYALSDQSSKKAAISLSSGHFGNSSAARSQIR